MSHVRLALAALWCAALFPSASLRAQGSLTPSTPPGPTHRSLDQVEPRIDVLSLPGDGTCQHLISAPGSYFLSGNAAGFPGRPAIAIASPDVSLDLRGFAVQGATGSPGTHALEIRPAATRNVVLRGGSVQGATLAGIQVAAGLTGIVLEDLVIRDCGTAGIQGAGPLTVQRCQVASCHGDGIQLSFSGSVLDCTVTDCTNGAGAAAGINASQVTRCRVTNVLASGNAFGIQADLITASHVQNVSSSSGQAMGISGRSIDDCHVTVVDAASGQAAWGLSGKTVAHSTASSVGLSSPANPIGISADSISHCFAGSIGNAASTGTIAGLSGGQIQGSAVNAVSGGPACNFVFGISAGTTILGGGSVSDCVVTNVTTNGSFLGGIKAVVASRCRVSKLTQAAGSADAGSYARGLDALNIVDCDVSQVSGNHPQGACGLAGFRLARGCTVSSISDSGGESRGLYSTQAALVEHCSVSGAKNGIALVGTGSQVRQCVITGLTALAADQGAAIYFSASSCRVEGCTISGANVGVYTAAGSNNLVDGCSFSAVDTGVVAQSGKVVVIRNRVAAGVSLCNPNSPSIHFGPLVSGSGSMASTHPWANFAD